MDDTKEDVSFLATTSQDNQRCTRLTGCKRAGCLTCNKTGTGTHHVQDLSQEFDTTGTHNVIRSRIASNAKMFKRSRWDDATKTQGMLKPMPIDKQSALVYMDSWQEFSQLDQPM